MRFPLFALAVLFLSGCAVATSPAVPDNVLFVGNSFTYYNNSLHNHYRALQKSADPDNPVAGRARSMTISGGYLREHAAGLAFMVNEYDWDVVVLQGYSRGPIEESTAESFRSAARKAAAEIRAHNAEPVFFMTWAYTGQPEMTRQLDDAYSAIGDELNADVVPVGLAFATVTEERPDIELRIADRKHPTLAGTYLAACTFYASLHGKSPEGIAYTAGLDAETAAYLQRVAAATVTDYRNRRQP
tara:strand:+ start:839 stop:1570 length:732 start_codon:yes stop_codon:yes gene_type:complete